MKVFVAGASGVLGRELLPRLVAAGHEVTGMTRTEANRALLEQLGARPVIADALDAEQVMAAVKESAPEVVVHELTAIAKIDMKHFDREFAQTNRLRTQGTDNLLAAARTLGARRFVAQSFAPWPYARTGGPIKHEDDPLDESPAREGQETTAALRHLEQAVLAADWTEGIALRYGYFYGPGTSLGQEGEQLALIRRRKFPIIGNGGGMWSFVHVSDAAEATVAAVEHGRRGIYNIVDDEPATVAEWLPEVARRLGAKRPWRVPRWVGRLAAGEAGVIAMTELRGSSNEKAKRELGWAPAHPTWREAMTAA